MFNNVTDYLVNGEELLKFLMDNGVNNTMVLKKLEDKFFNERSASLLSFTGADIYKQLKWIDCDKDIEYELDDFEHAFDVAKNYIGDGFAIERANEDIEDAVRMVLGLDENNEGEDDNYEAQELEDHEGIGMECEYLGCDE